MKRLLAAGAALLSATVNAGAAVMEIVGDDTPMPKPKKKAGHGARLAAARLKAHRAAQAERVKDVPEPTVTRQQQRQNARRMMKMPVAMRQDDWHRLKGLPTIKPSHKRREVAHV